ncbi:MAG: hypothetical protein ACOYOA_08470 [Saprospiraceae bacterium]
MELFTILLYSHILTGGTSLLLGSYILATKKGDQQHKLLGNIFFYSMLISAIIALVMSMMHTKYFLFIIGIFTSYMLLSGKRYLQKKQVTDVEIMDWLITAMMLIFGFGFIGFGVYLLINSNNFGVVMFVFGFISMTFVLQDYNNFTGKSKIKNYWMTSHIQRMCGAYIASATAFLVVNNHILPNVVAWLLPTLIIAPLISKWSRKYGIVK